MKIILALGSNINKETNIQKAKTLLKGLLPFIVFSRVIQTKAIGFNGNDFLNCIAIAYTNLPFHLLKQEIKGIEHNIGYSKYERINGIIKIDIDILQYGDNKLKEKDWKREYVNELLKELIF